jgi:hypothetical protein
MAHSQGVFISYRRDETSAHAGRLYDRLSDAFGEQAVFMDVDSIGLGLDFARVLDEALASCAVMLVLIGPGWLDTLDEHGRPRLHDPRDYMRLEVQAGLQRDIRVVPVLVREAELPPAEALPEPLRPLASRQAFRLPDEAFRSQAQVLVERLRPILGTAADREPASSATPRTWSAELVDTGWTKRVVKVHLTHEQHTVGYHVGLISKTVKVDGSVKVRVFDTKRREDGTMYDEADVQLSDGDDTHHCNVVVNGMTDITGMSLSVDGQVLYEE